MSTRGLLAVVIVLLILLIVELSIVVQRLNDIIVTLQNANSGALVDAGK